MELLATDKWLNALFNSDTQLTTLLGGRWYEGVAPDADPDDPDDEPPVYPLLIWQIPSSKEAHAAGGETTLTYPNLLVKIYGKGGGYGAIVPIYARLCALLEKPTPTPITVEGVSFTILGVTRNYPLQTPEVTDGIRYFVLGGSYKVYVEIGT